MYMLSLIGFLQTQTIIGRRIKFIFNHILQNRSQKWTISSKNTLFHPYPSKYPYFNISISIKKEEKTSSLKPTIKVPLEGMKSGGASFVCRHTRESISYLPKPSDPGQIIDIISKYTYQYAVFALSPAGTDLLLIVTISIIINKLTMINIATASRSDIIIIVRLLLLLLFHINNIYMEFEYMRKLLYATGYNKEKKKRIRRSYCPGYSVLFTDCS